MDSLVLLIVKKLNLNPDLVLKKKIRGLNGITVSELIKALISSDTVNDAATYLGYTDNPVKQAIRTALPNSLFPDKTPREFGAGGGSKRSWRLELLACIEHKYCHRCKSIKPYNYFHKNKSNYHEVESECASCKNTRNTVDKKYISLRTQHGLKNKK